MMDSVQPLRISKTTPASSPTKMPTSRPLSDIGSTSQRRNSPSYNQATKKMIVSRESSPYTENSSPFLSHPKASPRDFWSARETVSPFRFDENTPDRSPSPSLVSPKRRSSIERLKQASRVKNSNIFALESREAYDPSSMPIVERPSANRPLSQQLANNSFTRFDSLRKENNPMRSPQRPGHKRTESEINVPLMSPTKAAVETPLPASPERFSSPSPTKSSIARTSMFGMSPQPTFDPDNSTWSDEERAPTPRALHRHNKSVTFHADPPVVNEYEQQTPEPSVSVGSREGSWDSEDFDDQDMSFDRGSSADVEREDSFDEDLENTDKTPVVLPEDWTHMSPEGARRDLVNAEDDVFNGSSSAQRPILGRSESVTSDGEARPLPPLPGFMLGRELGSLAATAEKTSPPYHGLPSAPQRASCSKDDSARMARESSITLQDRLQLSNESNEGPTSTSSGETEHGLPEELSVTNLDTGEKMEVQVRVAEAALVDEEENDLPELADFADAPPRISRESILRKVRNTKYDFEDEDDEDESSLDNDDSPARPTYEELARMDPDQAIPSRENSRETSENCLPRRLSVVEPSEHGMHIKEEPMDDDGIDMSAIPALDDCLAPPRSPSRMKDYERQSSVLHHQVRSKSEEDDEDDASRYSHSEEPEAESTFLQYQQMRQEREPTVEDEGKETLQDAMQLLTMKDYAEPQLSAPEPPVERVTTNVGFMGLPTYFGTGDFDFGMKQYITPSPPATKEHDITAAAPILQPPVEFQEPETPVEPEISPPDSPASVIRRSSDVSSLHPELPEEAPEEVPEAPVPRDSPGIPERRATIRTGGKLKARKSGTRADLESMLEQRRMASADYPMPAIPHAYDTDAQTAEPDADEGSVYSEDSPESKTDSLVEQDKKPAEKRHQSRKMQLDLSIPEIGAGDADDLGLGLESEFDRVIKNQKVQQPDPAASFARFDAAAQKYRSNGMNIYSPSASASADTYAPISPFIPHARSGAGANVYPRSQKSYLMRQNTKVVVATNRNFSGDSNETVTSARARMEPPMSPSASSRAPRSANSSPRKPSAEQFLKTEPWNGKMRRQSVRNASAQKSACTREAAPPLPGQESALGVVDEDYAAGSHSLEDEVAEGVERGRLFVKVVGVKELALPMPKNDRIYFQLTLDNGLHCVTTANIELGTSAPIGQEFELVVLNDLEFQLTLTTKLPPAPAPPPAPVLAPPSSPNKTIRPQKSTAFSRFLTSPKKRAERERQEQEAAEAEERRRQEEAQRKRASVRPPTAWDRLRELVNATDGSFARAYVNLKSHEKHCFGRALTVDVPCYNEWALEQDGVVMNSVRSKRGCGTHNAGAPVRKPPYVIGKLEVQLLYVPKPKGATDESMPKSLSAAIREIGKAGAVVEIEYEGCLSQQGGDCTHWRRRFFRLQHSKLTAYHEHTHQKRAVINLSKASRLVDDKSTLVADPTASSSPSKAGKGRRKSAFAEEDEGYQYVEEGFRIRFANGETIDFYADSREEKERWMQVLSQVIGKPETGRKKGTWTDLVLAREKADALADAAAAAAATEDFRAPISTTEVKDFTRPAAPATALAPAANTTTASTMMMERNPSERKPVTGSRSVPGSPVKNSYPSARTAAPGAPAPAMGRPRTPPMKARTGHRARDAVKSTIF